MKKQFIFLTLAFISAWFEVNAADINGLVTDSQKRPMAYATVWVEGLNRTTVSGLKGTFTLRDIPDGTYQICATYIGHKKETAQVTVASDNVVCNFILDESAQVLPDIFVTPTGETIEEFIERMVAEHKKPLKERLASYDGSGSLYWETDNDSLMYHMPSDIFSPLKFALSLFKLGKFAQLERDHPGCTFIVDQELTFDGKINAGKQVVTKMIPTLKKEEVDYLERHGWNININAYDALYAPFDVKKIMKGRSKQKRAEEKAEKKGDMPEEDSLAVKYIGQYEEDGRDIYILQKGFRKYHIVDKIWQIKRSEYDNKNNEKLMVECRELSPGIFLPVSYYRKNSLDMSKLMDSQKDLDKLKAKDRSKMKASEISKLDKQISELEKHLQHPRWDMERALTWDYRNIVPATGKQ